MANLHPDGQNDLLIISTLDLIQGTLLLHPPSRSLFAREIYMNVRISKPNPPYSSHKPPVLKLSVFSTQLILDLLDPSNCPAIQSSTLLTLVVTLLDHPLNTRTFENLDGLLTVTSLFKMRATSREVKLKLMEFLYFYLMPEAPPTPALQRSPSKIGRPATNGDASGSEKSQDPANTRTTEEKQRLLSQYLNNVEDLVDDLRDNAPFGGTVY